MAPQVVSTTGLSADIIEFIRLLWRFKVRCLMVGGEAVIFHGYPRLTGDVNFLYDRTRDNAARLFKALAAFWDNDIPEVKTASELREPGIIGLAWRSRIPVELKTRPGSVRLFYIGIGPLRRNKRASGRAKDLDLEHLPAPNRRVRRSR